VDTTTPADRLFFTLLGAVQNSKGISSLPARQRGRARSANRAGPKPKIDEARMLVVLKRLDGAPRSLTSRRIQGVNRSTLWRHIRAYRDALAAEAA
jgi:DNA invertase Pin-like site-specific DNA recombinase